MYMYRWKSAGKYMVMAQQMAKLRQDLGTAEVGGAGGHEGHGSHRGAGGMGQAWIDGRRYRQGVLTHDGGY